MSNATFRVRTIKYIVSKTIYEEDYGNGILCTEVGCFISKTAITQKRDLGIGKLTR